MDRPARGSAGATEGRAARRMHPRNRAPAARIPTGEGTGAVSALLIHIYIYTYIDIPTYRRGERRLFGTAGWVK